MGQKWPKLGENGPKMAKIALVPLVPLVPPVKLVLLVPVYFSSAIYRHKEQFCH